MRVGRRLLVAGNTVAGVAVQGDLGWRKKREEMEVLFGKKLEDSQLEKLMMDKLREDGGIEW